MYQENYILSDIMGTMRKHIDNSTFPALNVEDTILFLTKRTHDGDTLVAWEKSVRPDVKKGKLFNLMKSSMKYN